MRNTYIKFRDASVLNDELIYVGENEPAENHVEQFGLKKDSVTGKWFTHWEAIDADKAELVCTMPLFKDIPIGHNAAITNAYIFKVEERDEEAFIE